MSVSISKATNAATGRAINPTQTGQASSYFASEYASQASRMVPHDGSQMPFDVTMGRVNDGYVRQTPTTMSGSPMVPRINANYQMVRDFRPQYVVDAHAPYGEPFNVQDVYTAAGTKWANATRDSYLTVSSAGPHGAPAVGAVVRADAPVDPVVTCAPGEQKMFAAFGAASGAPTNFSSIPEAYYNYNGLAANSNLVGVEAAQEPGKMTFASAYMTPQTFTAGPVLTESVFASPMSALSPADFSHQFVMTP